MDSRQHPDTAYSCKVTGSSPAAGPHCSYLPTAELLNQKESFRLQITSVKALPCCLPQGRKEAIGNLRAVQILLGHSSIENTVGYLGVDNDDALTLSARTEI